MNAANKDPKVIITVVNWNGWRDTIKCVESLQRIRYGNYEIVVVDNGSTDGSCEKLKSKIPDIDIVKSEKNLGFSGGHNLGIKFSMHKEPRYFLLLNNDTVVEENFLNALIEEGESVKNAGILSPVEYDYDDRGKLSFVAGRISLLKGPIFPPVENERLISEESRIAPLLGGCCMLIRREVIDRVGFLDESYFLYYEEADFCAKALKAGFLLMSVPKSKIWHKGRRSSGKNFSRIYAYYGTRNILYYASKHMKLYRRLFFYTFFLFSISLTHLRMLFSGDREGIRVSRRAVFDFIANRMGKADLD